jgi:CheY-like chemotaxis protein
MQADLEDTKATVLIVEDDNDNRAVLRALLEEAGYLVAEAETTDAARAFLRTSPNCVVLLYYLLPFKSGISLLRDVLRDDTLRRHRYVLLTSLPLSRIPVTDRQVAETVCTEVIQTVFDAGALLRAVAQGGAALSCVAD